MTEETTLRADLSRSMLPVDAFEVELELPAVAEHTHLLSHLGRAVVEQLDAGVVPTRLAVTGASESGYRCELGVVAGLPEDRRARTPSIFDFRPRRWENESSFTTVFVVPTGIGSSIGGHAGDATPAAQLLASVSDTLVTHPNVVNASDLNELPANALYVEGSVVARVLMGTVGLAPVRSNRVLVVADAHPDSFFSDQLLNSVNAARSSFALTCPRVVLLDPPLPVESLYAASGRAVGHVHELERLFGALDRYRGEYDAVALSTQIRVDPRTRLDYYGSRGGVVNPWGGVEAILTHAVSALYDVPAAHSPMLESREVAALALGVVDPRMAAEVISVTFFVSVLKGLQRSPRIVATRAARPGLLTVEHVSCLVIPDGAVGLPTLAALEQGIPVVAVRENENLMENDLRALPWARGQLEVVDNYWEAAGVVACLRAGIDPTSVRRPLAEVRVETSRAKPTGRASSGPGGRAAGETPLQFRSATDSGTPSVPACRANPEHAR
ncbi:MAG: DUF3326 domain-containing protein [Gaiellaceae bacterium]